MITIENCTVPVFVGTAAGEVGLTNVGRWNITGATNISVWTNAAVSLGAYRDGAVALVDGSGVVFLTDGPALDAWVIFGAETALASVGFVMAILWVWRKMMLSAKIHAPVE